MWPFARQLFLSSCLSRSRLYSSATQAKSSLPPTVAIVGSGPASFYVAQQLLKLHPSMQVDLLERLPVPFGLVRYGVAPDHPDVKNVITGFTKIARDPRLAFFGNVSVGTDVRLRHLLDAYTAVVLAYGASRAKRLGIPGEDSLDNVLSARDFVNWYNGFPGAENLKVDLAAAETAVIIGHGNVALDVARILLSSPDRLRRTDAPEAVLRRLAEESEVRRVRLVGRRGLLQAAFTTKEFRELARLDGVGVCLEGAPSAAQLSPELLAGLPRPRRRLTELVLKSAENPEVAAQSPRQLTLHFLLSPLEFLASAASPHRVGSVQFKRNRHSPADSPTSDKVEATDELVGLDCGLAVVSVGYENVALDPLIPMDSRTGVVANDNGKISGLDNAYCAGWLKTGPSGVLLSTMSDSFHTAQRLLEDLNSGRLPTESRTGRLALVKELRSRGVRYTTFADWERIDAAEQRSGRSLGKPREKILSVDDFLRAASDSSELDDGDGRA
ncbi:hypothetical protein BOX15_Mlig030444g2 [Macrostomum lignano]|uniref:NADPH:adrenodoxin oxidoreductase, mitochondrial n=2 Tax=Macrostomum lignano TaxID=282301 RepID=A0A267FUA1_9PLAT|nr:hypothetical protein BOX15_Mlig030444g2 [Macrostomum lignano]